MNELDIICMYIYPEIIDGSHQTIDVMIIIVLKDIEFIFESDEVTIFHSKLTSMYMYLS